MEHHSSESSHARAAMEQLQAEVLVVERALQQHQQQVGLWEGRGGGVTGRGRGECKPVQ
jgi:hypothetical protein